MKELAKFTSTSELRYHPTPYRQEHTIKKPLVVTASSLFQLDMMMNIDPSVFRDTPTYFDDVFIVKDFFSIYGLNTDVFGPHLLVRNYGETLVDYYPVELGTGQIDSVSHAIRVFTGLARDDLNGSKYQ